MKYNKGDFTVVPSKNARKGLKPVLQTAYTWLAEHSNDNMESWPSRKVLAEEVGVSIDTLDKALKDLVELGLIKKEERYVDNEQTTNMYQVMIVDKVKGAVKTTLPSRKIPTQNSTQLTQPINSNTNVLELSDDSDLLKPQPKAVYGNPDVTAVLEMFTSITGLRLNKVALQRRYASLLLKSGNTIEDVRAGLAVVAASMDDKYAPSISNIEDLYHKWGKLQVYARKRGAQANKRNTDDLDSL